MGKVDLAGGGGWNGLSEFLMRSEMGMGCVCGGSDEDIVIVVVI